MKKALFLLCLCFGAWSVCVAGTRKLSDSREITVNRPYTALDASGGVRVVLKAGQNPSSVRVEAVGLSAREATVMLREGVLIVSCNPRALRTKRSRSRKQKSLTVYVGTGALETFYCSGMSEISSDAAIRKRHVQIEAAAKGKLSLPIESESCDLFLSSSSSFGGSVVCTGRVTATVSGMSSLAADVECRTCELMFNASSFHNGTVECLGHAAVTAAGMCRLQADIMSSTLAMQLSGSSSCGGTICCSERVAVTAGGMCAVRSNIECQALEIQLVGASTCDGHVRCGAETRVGLSGRSRCTVGGTTCGLVLSAVGTSTFSGAEFSVTGLAVCELSGCSTARMNCPGLLKYTVIGSSRFNYTGNPKILSATVGNASVSALE